MFRKAFWLFGIAVIMLVLFLPGYARLQDLKQRNKDLQSKIRQLNQENELLYSQMQRLQKDPAYLEKFAREKMGIVRKGEVVYKMPEEEQ